LALHPAVARWQGNILEWAHQRSLPPELIAVVIQIESCGDPRALSSSGASGLFQVMPFHFSVGESPFDIETNARRGLDYLERSLQLAGGNPALAMAGYNGGHGVIPLPPGQWPSETQRYVSWGSGILEDLRHAGQASPTLRAWLLAGGERLCREAQAHAGPAG
jgi:soluble lytic murein transglycosylase-like protein